MQRHQTATFARYALHVTLIACCGCVWNAAADAPERTVDNDVSKSTAESRPLRARLTRSVAPEIGHLPVSFSTSGADRSDDEEPTEDSSVYGHPLDLAAWEPEADDSDDLEQLPHGDIVDKRKWGENKARVWGKRKWGDNRARVWGKRLAPGQVHRPSSVSSQIGGEQRTAAEANILSKFQAENRKLLGEALSERGGKRKWGENKARIWGK